MRKISYILSILMFTTLLFANIAHAAPAVAQKSVLTGKVISVANVGDSVKEGQALLQVQTSVGVAVASRATIAGTVNNVTVKVGDTVKTQQVIMSIQPKP